MNIFANFATIDSRMIKSAFFSLKMKTIADNPQDADGIDALTFHPHQVKQRACRRLRNLLRQCHGKPGIFEWTNLSYALDYQQKFS